ncbi:hypothetical protein GCM10023063_15380 [Arthrobacter methylotrophus]|uniref:Uncharacterized protein n=1 Tax=Arthrobacter methylotrophus TaxID=121291 RepID=A0ABV5UN59_9MICC
MSHTPDPRANGISTNDYCALLPKQRYSHEARGLMLLLPSSGLVVVPFEERKGGGWTVAVVEGFGSYPVGGHHLVIGDAEAETAIELSLGEPVPVRSVQDSDEADTLPDGTVILTRAGYSLRKDTDEAGTIWTRFLEAPVRTADLGDDLFPAKVRSAVPVKESTSV